MTVATANLVRLISTVILTRLLDPSDFGVAGVLGAITMVFALVSDVGLFPFTVRHKDGDVPEFLDEVWSIRLVRCTVLALMLILFSGFIADLLKKPELQPAIAVSCAGFLLEGLSSMSFATAVREQQLRRLAMSEILVLLLQLAVAVPAALWLSNYWAIVIASLAANSIRLFLSYAVFPGSVRRFRLNWERIGELWRFGRLVMVSTMLTLVLTQSDKVLLTRLMPLELLGLFIIGGSLASAPLGMVSQYSNQVIFPLFSRIWRENPSLLPQVYYGWRRRMTLAYMFTVGGAIGGAPVIVAILYEPRYEGVIFFLRLLLINPLLAMNNTIANETLVARGLIRNTLVANLIRVAWVGLAGTVGYLYHGAIGILVAYATVEIAALMYYWSALAKAQLLRRAEEILMLLVGVSGIGAGLLASAGFFAVMSTIQALTLG